MANVQELSEKVGAAVQQETDGRVFLSKTYDGDIAEKIAAAAGKNHTGLFESTMATTKNFSGKVDETYVQFLNPDKLTVTEKALTAEAIRFANIEQEKRDAERAPQREANIASLAHAVKSTQEDVHTVSGKTHVDVNLSPEMAQVMADALNANGKAVTVVPRDNNLASFRVDNVDLLTSSTIAAASTELEAAEYRAANPTLMDRALKSNLAQALAGAAVELPKALGKDARNVIAPITDPIVEQYVEGERKVIDTAKTVVNNVKGQITAVDDAREALAGQAAKAITQTVIGTEILKQEAIQGLGRNAQDLYVNAGAVADNVMTPIEEAASASPAMARKLSEAIQKDLALLIAPIAEEYVARERKVIDGAKTIVGGAQAGVNAVNNAREALVDQAATAITQTVIGREILKQEAIEGQIKTAEKIYAATGEWADKLFTPIEDGVAKIKNSHTGKFVNELFDALEKDFPSTPQPESKVVTTPVARPEPTPPIDVSKLEPTPDAGQLTSTRIADAAALAAATRLAGDRLAEVLLPNIAQLVSKTTPSEPTSQPVTHTATPAAEPKLPPADVSVARSTAALTGSSSNPVASVPAATVTTAVPEKASAEPVRLTSETPIALDSHAAAPAAAVTSAIEEPAKQALRDRLAAVVTSFATPKPATAQEAYAMTNLTKQTLDFTGTTVKTLSSNTIGVNHNNTYDEHGKAITSNDRVYYKSDIGANGLTMKLGQKDLVMMETSAIKGDKTVRLEQSGQGKFGFVVPAGSVYDVNLDAEKHTATLTIGTGKNAQTLTVTNVKDASSLLVAELNDKGQLNAGASIGQLVAGKDALNTAKTKAERGKIAAAFDADGNKMLDGNELRAATDAINENVDLKKALGIKPDLKMDVAETTQALQKLGMNVGDTQVAQAPPSISARPAATTSRESAI